MTADDETLRRTRGMKRMTTYLLIAIKAVAGAVGLYYGFLVFLDAPFDRITQAFDAGSPIRFGLFLFFFGWLWGANDDTNIQAGVFESDPNEGRVGIAEFGGIIGFIAVFVALFQLNDNLVIFQCALLLFICVNVVTWSIIVRRTQGIYRANADIYLGRSDNAAYLKLAIVSDYMNGKWQRYRFATLIALAAIQVAVALLVKAGIVGAALRGMTIKGIPGNVLAAYLPGLLFILYVVISELWMKVYRIKVKSDMVTVDYIDTSYRITRQPKKPVPALNMSSPWDFSETPNDNYA